MRLSNRIPSFWKHSIIYIVLSTIMLFNVVPTILLIPQGDSKPETITSYGILFNELYEKTPTLYESNWIRETVNNYIPYGMDTFGDHHQLGNVYRAVRTGEPLSNLGYNDSFSWKMHSKTNTQDLIYKSSYLSLFNNTAELVYAIMPYKHADTKEKMIANAQAMSIIRYIFGVLHILGYIFLFMGVLKYLGSITAWCVGTAILMYPTTLIGGISGYGVSNSALIYLAAVVWFYPKIISHFSYKTYILFIVGMWILGAIISYPSGYIGFTIYTWAPAIVTAFLLEIYRIYSLSIDFKKALGLSIIRVSILALITLSSSLVIFYFELQQASTWLGENINMIEYLFSRSTTPDAARVSIITFISHYIASPMTAPHLWIYRFSPMLLNLIPTPLYNFPFIIGCLIVLFITKFISQYFKNSKEFRDIKNFFLITVACYGIYFLALSFGFPRMMYHYHMFTGNLMIYQILIIMVLLGEVLTLFSKNYKISKIICPFIEIEKK